MSATCESCAHVRSFRPRPDEKERFGWTDKGHECRRRGWEGYVPDLSRPPCAGQLFAAQGTPTRSAETVGLGPKDGGPVGNADAPEQGSKATGVHPHE